MTYTQQQRPGTWQQQAVCRRIPAYMQNDACTGSRIETIVAGLRGREVAKRLQLHALAAEGISGGCQGQ